MTATTLNPADKAASATLSNGNLTVANAVGAFTGVRSTTSKATSGKHYFEVTFNVLDGGINAAYVGIGNATESLTAQLGSDANGLGWKMEGTIHFSGSSLLMNLGTIAINSVIGVALDMGNKNVWMRGPSGNWNGSGTDNPATNTGGLNGSAFFNAGMNTFLGGSIFALPMPFNSSSFTINFGASATSYTVPSGFTTWDAPAVAIPGRTLIFS